VPIKNFPVSDYVAAQVKNIRKRRRWSQQDLADRLSELLAGPPPEIFKEDDERRRSAESRAALPRKWTQTRVAKLERGALKRVSVDDVLELALGLDVSPLVLMTPTLEPQDKAESWSLLRPGPEDSFRVALGGEAFTARDVRQWIRGVNPLLGALAYRTNEDAMAGRLFYFVESQPLSEVDLIKEAGDYTEQILGMRALLSPSEEKDDAE
jgi:transcriptional regulator with XRE-family HTH domain